MVLLDFNHNSIIGKIGVNPTRTRHCNADIYFIAHWFLDWEGEKDE
jgi:hypothetical protein